MTWLIAGILFIILIVFVNIWTYIEEKKLWNGGVCKRCNTRWLGSGAGIYVCECSDLDYICVTFPGIATSSINDFKMR